VLGVLGAIVGPFALGLVGVNLGIRNALASQIVTATIGAMIVILLAGIIR
jgi:uncharacterized membrane protein YeaQ/YmgE (transglycosylase-associated protein family)